MSEKRKGNERDRERKEMPREKKECRWGKRVVGREKGMKGGKERERKGERE